ncbi:hypothetical protein VC273_01405 [Xanthomonas nasturtii]|uniref:hypothetical protein n=1 Tax=Xanthomonas TaxID=338 RepID=UPI002B228140|nr:hypothetical protein [Xanthomonas nasturtii]MEA9554629.1 hypothetical protein [Xanthomonas nasturtii]
MRYSKLGGRRVTARSTPNGNRLEVSEDDCTVRLQLLGELLIVANNLQCGGANVSFSGVYRQDHARRP